MSAWATRVRCWAEDPRALWIGTALAMGLVYLQAAFRLFTEERVRDSLSYYFASVAFRVGVDPYSPQALKDLAPDSVGHVFPYLYPPLLAQLWTPLTALAPGAAHDLVVLANALLAVVNVVLLERIFDVGRTRSALFLGFVSFHAVCGPLVSSVRLGQINVLLFTLVLTALWLETRGRPVLAGLALASAILFKLTPAVYALDLVARRRWATLISTVVWIALLVAGSMLAGGVRPWAQYLETVGRPFPFQPVMSIHGLLAKLGLGTEPGALPWAWLLAIGALTSLLLVRELRVFRKGGDPVANWSLLTLYGLLASPLTWHHHYYAALLPFGFLLFAARGAAERWAWGAVGVLALLRYPGSLHFWKPVAALIGFLFLRPARFARATTRAHRPG